MGVLYLYLRSPKEGQLHLFGTLSPESEAWTFCGRSLGKEKWRLTVEIDDNERVCNDCGGRLLRRRAR